jgi:hypothetical protein
MILSARNDNSTNSELASRIMLIFPPYLKVMEREMQDQLCHLDWRAIEHVPKILCDLLTELESKTNTSDS